MCAGKLAWGPNNTNACPAGSSVIVDEAQCQAAAATVGMVYGGSVSYAGRPRGCYWVTGSGTVGLNTHPTGAANQYIQPLCAVAATGVRVMCVRACVRACARGSRVCVCVQ